MEKYIQYSENRQKENLLAINAHEVLEEKKLHDFIFKRLWSFNKNMELLFLQRYCIDIFRKTLNNIDGLRIFSRQPNSPLLILPYPWIFVGVNTRKSSKASIKINLQSCRRHYLLFILKFYMVLLLMATV